MRSRQLIETTGFTREDIEEIVINLMPEMSNSELEYLLGSLELEIQYREGNGDFYDDDED